MQLFNPQAKLFVKRFTDTLPEYYLHVVTNFNTSNYCPAGYGNIIPIPDSNGFFSIDLKVSKDAEPFLPCETPVVHTLSLGQFPFSDINPSLKVNITSTAGEFLGSSEVHQGDAEEDGKPGKDSHLNSVYQQQSK